MSKKISGTTSDSAKVYIIDESTDTLEAIENITTGSYSIESLTSGDKTISGATRIVIKRIKRGIVPFQSDGLYFSEVFDENKTILINNGATGGGSDNRTALDNFPDLDVTSSGSLLYYPRSVSYGTSSSFEIVEFDSGIKSVQRGYTDISTGTDQYVAINEVNPDNCITMLIGNELTGNNIMARAYVDASGVQVRVQNNAVANTGMRMGWQVIEFDDNVIDTRQTGYVQVASAYSDTASLETPVDLDRSVIFNRGLGGTQTGRPLGELEVAAVLTDSSTVTGYKEDSSYTGQLFFYVVEFAEGIINSVQRGYTVLDGTPGSITVPITPVNLNKSILLCTGWTSEDDECNDYKAAYLTENAVRVLGHKTSSVKAGIAWQVVEFA